MMENETENEIQKRHMKVILKTCWDGDDAISYLFVV